MKRLENLLGRINGRGYPQYKQLKGRYHFNGFDLEIVHVQGDPFAAPTKLAVRIPAKKLGIDTEKFQNPSRRVGLEDGILRGLVDAFDGARKSRGSGKSGQWGILTPGQEILPRTAVELRDDEVIIRLTLGLPAAGRRILAKEAETLLLDDLPEILTDGLSTAREKRWYSHADSNEDQETLRSLLDAKNWVGFVADGSLLPRASGADDRPMAEGGVAWESPEAFRATVTLPHRGEVTGTFIPEGVTLICGGGYHGKSTLLSALARGVYNHIPGDGRELCVSRYDAVGVRAEDGRSVCSVNISAFINNLPNGKETERFSTENASGSTSQAANIVEALELGASCLLIDEDTSATNFMVRDRRMQELVATHQEPITPFVDRVRHLYDQLGVSTVIVVGGAGDYFDVADQVLLMNQYRPTVATDKAKEIGKKFPSQRAPESRPPVLPVSPRVPLANAIDASTGRGRDKVKAHQTRTIAVGRNEIEVTFLPQLIDDGQTRTLGDWILKCARGEVDSDLSLREICEGLERKALEQGLFSTTPGDSGDRVFARRYELAAAINRLRTLQIAE